MTLSPFTLFNTFRFQALTERGEKLSDLDMKTAEMNVRAKAFADAAHQLSLKYKDKKWYQV